MSNKPRITICTVNHNSSDFIALMLESFHELTKNPYKVIIRDSNSRKADRLHLKKIAAAYDNVSVYETTTALRGSMDHGTGLNDLVQQIDTEYGVIMDADAVFLSDGWDELLINRLTGSCPIYGTQADIGSGKPEDFPLMFAIIFKTDIMQSLHIDFRPKDTSQFQDTGWELREKYGAAGYRGGLLYSFNTRTYKGGPFASVICTEYYDTSTAAGPIIAAHFGRGSAPTAKNLVRVGPNRNLLYRMLNKALWYANVMRWKRDKRKWIAISRTIIHSQ